MKSRPLLLSALFFVSACETDAQKLTRLQERVATAELIASSYEWQLDSLRVHVSLGDGAVVSQIDSINALLQAARTEATLAERDLNRFMR